MSTKTGTTRQDFVFTDKHLLGIVLAVTTYFLFAQTVLNVVGMMREDLGIEATEGNIAVSLTSLFAGVTVVVFGGLADRIGRKRITFWGLGLSILGSLLIAITPADAGALTTSVLYAGRMMQGLSAACIMPATLALVKAYVDGAERQRALSFWSIGSWGGSGITSLLGGLVASAIGWRWIFVVAIVVAAVSFFLVRDLPESTAEGAQSHAKFDWGGLTAFIIALVSINIWISQGSRIGWLSPVSIGLLLLFIVGLVIFLNIERKVAAPFMHLDLFKDRLFTGATVSNFLLNSCIGTLLVALGVVQAGAGFSTLQAGLLTVGYLVAVLVSIRLGERFLKSQGPRNPMLWGTLLTAIGILPLSFTGLLIGQYVVVAVIGFTIFGVGLGLYATPSLDAALTNVPADQAGSASGIYKMASLLGGAFGTAISGAIYSGLANVPAEAVHFVTDHFLGRTDNASIRYAALVALLVNVAIALLAHLTIRFTIPQRKKQAASS